MSIKPSAYSAALKHFTEHESAVAEVEQITRAAEGVEARLTAAADTAKPDFAAISRMHSERGHLATRLQRAAATVASLEASYVRPGETLYHEANRARDRAADAAVECVHARLNEDFTGDTLAHVARRHPVLIAEDTRNSFVHSPTDLPDFKAFAAQVHGIASQIEQADARAAIYRKATASRSLPSQADLNAATPESAKPAAIKPRHERTDAEQDDHDLALETAETQRTRKLFHQARELADALDEPGLLRFCAANPSVRQFFPVARNR